MALARTPRGLAESGGARGRRRGAGRAGAGGGRRGVALTDCLLEGMPLGSLEFDCGARRGRREQSLCAEAWPRQTGGVALFVD
jgi:hypothetical protein